MKFLVVGASGFLGSAILRRLREKRFEAIGTQCSSGRPDLINFNLADDRIEQCLPKAFVSRPEQLCAIVATTARAMDDCAGQQRGDFIHIHQTLQLLKDLAGLGARIVFMSSGFVFDGTAGYYTENELPHPINDYGRQKLAVETGLAADVPDAVIFRLEKIVSDEMASRNPFTQWLNTVRSGKPIECIAGQIFAPTATTDIADAALLAFEARLRGLYHLCTPEFFLREELAFQFCRIVGLKTKILSKPMEDFGFAEPRPLKTYLDSSKFRQATGLNFTPVRRVIESFGRNCLA